MKRLKILLAAAVLVLVVSAPTLANAATFDRTTAAEYNEPSQTASQYAYNPQTADATITVSPVQSVYSSNSVR